MLIPVTVFTLPLLLLRFAATAASSSSFLNFTELSCNTNSLFSPNTTYASNLDALLSSLSTNVTTSPSGFANSTSGPIHGLGLCRGDVVSTHVCPSCISMAIENLRANCSLQKEAIVWQEWCMLRYSANLSLFTSIVDDDFITLYNSEAVTGDGWLTVLGSTLDDVTAAARNHSAGANKFATKEAAYRLETLYSLAQCTPDLTEGDCAECLRAAVVSLEVHNKGGIALLPSCSLRYETYPFYNNSVPRLSPPPDTLDSRGKKGSSAKLIVPVIILVVLLLLAAAGISMLRLTNIKRPAKPGAVTDVELCISSNEFTDSESLQYDLNILQAATNSFSHANKLGEGGFGVVFRGKLPNGQEIAVKRLSLSSRQGVAEFKNEVVLVAKLQHRNLVGLLGYCLAADEKLLVYEFVPNKSLDYFLFDPEKQAELDWTRRYKIIRGIARGLLYLHEDSRLRIIHRDIKPSNILLEVDMTPKISDFGLAKILGIDQARGNTHTIAGTYGYMAPEYAFNGEFSESSDVYSFGVLVLEIISGQKINSFRQSEYPEHLMSYAWKKWKDNEPLEMMDPSLREGTDSKEEVIRCIHLALLCVQEDVVARPSMSTVVMALNHYSIALPLPQNPAFYTRDKTMFIDTKPLPSSLNFVSISEVGPR